MNRFRNILFVSKGIEDETESLKQALSLASNNKAALKIMVIYPQLPGELKGYRGQWESHLEEGIKQTARSSYATLNRGELDIQLSVTIEGTTIPEVQIIRQVLRDQHDLVIKSAEAVNGGKGFKALDMELLRKCPCPLWLARPIARSRDHIRIAVAIDPEGQEKTANDLALNLLALAGSLAATCSGELDIVSCWDCEYEGFLRNNPFGSIPEDKVFEAVIGIRQNHRQALDALIDKADLNIKTQTHHLRGRPEAIIPEFVSHQKIDILVMGTVARTGIPGFIMGNTAENLIQELKCSLLATKPNGFVSPITAY